MNNSTLAIVIPYYKLTFFDLTLQSLANQTDKRFKLYIGNDASPENPAEVLSKYENDFDFEYHIFQENLGGKSLTQQWERCLDLAKNEEWVLFLGDDDTLGENCVSDFYINLEKINNEKCKVIRFATVVIDQNDNIISKEYFHPETELSTDFVIRHLEGGSRTSLSEYIYKKDSVKKVGFKNLPLAWYSDILAILEFSEFGKIYTINSSFVSFRMSNINITTKTDNMTLKDYAAFKYYYYLLNEKGKYFDAKQKEVLYEKLEKNLGYNKKNIEVWMLFFILYLKRLNLKRGFALMTKGLKSIFNKK
ncbi:MAG: glycosyltransferase family A protein [Bacteroidota bacterium]